jgi:hypothetical protein
MGREGADSDASPEPLSLEEEKRGERPGIDVLSLCREYW